MTAHTTIGGCDFRGHDHATELMVGGIDAMDLTTMGDGYDYLALGHIHHEQYVHSGKHNVRYCGSPLPVGFDESFTHSVSIVEIGKHGDTPNMEKKEIINPHPLVTLPTEGFATWEEATLLLSQFPADIPAYIRLNVEIEDFLPLEAQAEASLLTEEKQCRFCCINARRKAARQTEAKMLSVQEFQAEEPVEIAKRFAEDTGINFDSEMQDMFHELMTMVSEDARNDDRRTKE